MDDDKELILELLRRADAEHTPVEKLYTASGYLTAKVTRRSIKKVINNLNYSAAKLFNKYCKAVTSRQSDVYMLLAYKRLCRAVEFYHQELDIINKALLDYEEWLWNGNIIRAFIFGERRGYYD